MTNEQRSFLIAHKAQVASVDAPFSEEVRKFALEQLQAAYRAGADSIRNSSDYSYKEDMGR